MMTMRKAIALGLVSVMTLGLLSACGGGGGTTTTSAPSAAASGTAEGDNSQAPSDTSGSGSKANLNVCVASEPQTIDPCLNSSVDGAIMTQHLFEGLMRWTDSGKAVEGVSNANLAELVPGQAAEQPEKVVNDDGTVTYTFHLRDGLRWSDGKELTASDFVYSWQRLSNPETAADYCYMIDMVVGYEEINTGVPTGEMENVLDDKGQPVLDENGQPKQKEVMKHEDPSTLGVSAPDDKTFVVNLTYDCPYFLEVCAFPATFPVRQDVVEANKDGWTHEVSTYLSNGPYRMTKWDHNAQIVMEKNPEYYDTARLGPDTITFRLMDNDNAILNSFQGEELDFIENVPVDEIETLLGSGQLSIVPYIGTYYVCYNTEKEPFNDPRVRHAFTLAIDSQYIVDNVTQTGQVPATGFVPSGVSDADPSGADFRTTGGDYWTAPTTAEQYQKNVEEAKQLLAEAGYPNGEGFPTITYLYNTDDNHQSIGEALQQQWQSALNVQVKLENQDWSVFLTTRKEGDFQVARNGWIADYNDPISFLDMWLTGGGNNDAQYSNPDYDAAIREAKSIADPAGRMAAMHKAEDILMKQDWTLGPIYFYTQKYMLNENVKGMYYTPLGYFFFDQCTKN